MLKFGLPNPDFGQCVYYIQRYHNRLKSCNIYLYQLGFSQSARLGFVVMWLLVSHLLKGHFSYKDLAKGSAD